MQFWSVFIPTLGALAASPQSLNFQDYVVAQTQAALKGILDNTYAADSPYPGVIVASPALDTARAGESGGQNYYYQWTRDASLTIKTLINQYASGDSSLEPFIKAYIDNERKLQRLDTLSGNFTSGGLGEPKFYVNSTSFDDHWARPQRDGPALRAVAIMGFLSLQQDAAYIKNVTDTVVKPDLDYVASTWQDLGFDLWEEQNNLHFFTAMAQARALREGAAFMTETGDNDTAAKYTAQGAGLSKLIDSFWNSTGTGTFDAQLNLTKPTGADCANLLAANHNAGPGAQYSPSSDKILASAATLIDEMTGLHPIDAKRGLSAISLGRYASDVYDGIQTSKGNPWFLCNSAMAETLYLAATEFTAAGNISITNINRHFFTKVNVTAKTGTIYSGSNLSSVIDSIRTYADQFLAIEQLHVGQNFSMAEEFNRTSGKQQGARDLTWSYAAFVTAARARAGQLTYDFTQRFPSNVDSTDSASRSYSSAANSNSTILTLGTSSASEVKSRASFSQVSGLLAVPFLLLLIL
ncbi:Probable glucoamylase [Taphrina deformans PYCC 5710]|uniref:glucan 1,4-alpha-glucosidase n=1 Tax=Taphrina deformans (strain PYCC 5710 / ATCC 11124 / CBS 356.35 / IMI 108563 / JCM 9778 / NBRC 8474) TaxID=1097556 RepID=R4XF11_TAPDE|nr:Probable glucoamylase [Taphrina deformans PYCC 5710]|eukprot:CCG83056.1 Probable glucoamylase [Taphrina deformans PYCC 5710]